MWNTLRECLREGRDFLYRHDLRNLTYVRLLPQSGRRDIARRLIESTEVPEIEKGFMYDIFDTWQDYCNSQGSANQYLLRRYGEIYSRIRDSCAIFADPVVPDEYRGCYMLGELTPFGEALRMETRTCQGIG